MRWILLVHVASTLFMTGVIWFVQFVHYPLFMHADASAFARFAREHSQRTTWIVAPAMLLELTVASMLVWTRPGVLTLSGAGLLAVIWLSTWLLQIPAHAALAPGFDADVHARLVRGNWIRTVAWSLRAIIAMALLAGDYRPLKSP